MEITGTETGKNLQKAFEINAKRSLEYNMYALIAKQLGYEDISSLLTRFANNEKEHAKLWYKWIYNGKFPNLTDCLKTALTQEKDEIEGVYESFARKAKEEGFEHIAGLLENIENIERVHYDRLRNLSLSLKTMLNLMLTGHLIGFAVYAVQLFFKKMNLITALFV